MEAIYWFQEYIADGDSLITFNVCGVIYKLNKKNDKITNFSKSLYQSLNIPVPDVGYIDIGYYMEDKNGQVWIHPRNQRGLYITNKAKNIAFDLYPDPHNPFSVSSNFVESWYEDKNGIIWIGTLGGGVNKYIKDKDIFRVITVDINESECSVRSIHEDIYENGLILWIGTEEQGLLRYNMETREIKQYYINCPIRAICQTKSDPDNIWIGTLYWGLLKFNKKNKTFSNQYFNKSKEDLKKINLTHVILSITIDEKGILWIGTVGGLIRFDPDTKKFKHYFRDLNNKYSLSDNQVNSLFFSNYKNEPVLWVGTRHGGLNRFDPDKEKFYHFKNNPDDSLSIASDYISSIYEDDESNLWIGTTNGLQKFDRIKNKFFRYVDKDGLLNIDIMGILEGKNGILWLHTKSGICRFNTQNRSLRFLDEKDGLPAKDFYRYAYYENKRGDLYFGGNNKILVFNPAKIQKNTNIPPIVITDFQIFNESVKPGNDSPLSKTISNTDEIILPFNQSVFSFEFAALDYTIPDKNKYAYKMEGVDPDWVYSDASHRYVTYTNLDPGKYVLRIKGSNNDGVWNEVGTSVSIIITPPWWGTWWAYSLYGLLFLSTLYGLRRYELNRLSFKNQVKMDEAVLREREEMDRMKSNFFANISHEFRTPLTLILGPIKQISEKIKDNKTKNELKIIYKNAGKLLRLVNQLLDLSKVESGNMKLQTVPQNIVSVIKILVLSFSSYAERKKIKLKFDSTEEEIITYIDKEKIEKIVTNILSNAFKFTPEDGQIEVNVTRYFSSSNSNSHSEPALPSGRLVSESPSESTKLKRVQLDDQGFVGISIRDTGIGIPKEKLSKIFDRFYQVDDTHKREQEGTGIGLALTKELIELHKGKIEVESEDNKGSKFSVYIPLGKKHLFPQEIVESIETQRKVTDLVIEEYDNELKKKKLELDFSFNNEKPVLLIVEDNYDLRKYIIEILSEYYKISEAEDGEEGFRLSIEQIPDLIISDVMMPKMDGYELCDKLKINERTSHIPIILLTAKATSDDKIEWI